MARVQAIPPPILDFLPPITRRPSDTVSLRPEPPLSKRPTVPSGARPSTSPVPPDNPLLPYTPRLLCSRLFFLRWQPECAALLRLPCNTASSVPTTSSPAGVATAGSGIDQRGAGLGGPLHMKPPRHGTAATVSENCASDSMAPSMAPGIAAATPGCGCGSWQTWWWCCTCTARPAG